MKRNLGAKDLMFPAPVLIVASYNEDGSANAMNVAWGGICSSNPPAAAISIRGQRKTLANINKRQAFTINIANEELMAEADYFGIVSGNNVADKVKSAGLTAVKAEHVDAPYIEEFPVALECRVLSITDIGEHKHIVGEIVNVVADEKVLDAGGKIDTALLKAIGFDPAGGNYIAASEIVGKAFSIGAVLVKK